MGGKRPPLSGLILIAFLAVSPAPAQTVPPPPPGSSEGSGAAEVFPPRDDAEKALLGVARFELSGEAVPDTYLGDNIARLLAEKIAEIPAHYVGDPERDALAAAAVAAARRTVLMSLDDLQSRRSALLFSGSLPHREPAGRASLEASIEAARMKLRDLDLLNPRDVAVRRERMLVFSAPKGEGELLLPPAIHPPRAAERAGVDYLVHGTVDAETEDFFTATAYLYGTSSGLTLGSARATGSRGDTDRVAADLFRGLATAVAGRAWAFLRVSAEPEDAEVFADDVLIGIGEGRLAFVAPGAYQIRVAAPGHHSREETLELAPFAVEERRVELTPMDPALLRVDSDPPGAAAYLGALRMGSTPLDLSGDGPSQILRLEAQGHKSLALVFPPRASSSRASSARDDEARAEASRDASARDGDPGPYRLPRDLFPWKERIESKRKSFYRAFGWFVLSVPAPVLLNGLYQNRVFGYLQYLSGPSPDPRVARGMAEKADFLYHAYFGSLFISGSLLVNAVQKLFDYIHTGEESQRHPERWRKD